MPPVASHTWTHPSALLPQPPITSVLSNHTSLREIQVTPDPENEDEPVDDKEGLQLKINLPEELELSEQVISPPDSGLGQSIHEDEVMKDEEEDSGARESDDDSEFTPTKRTARHTITVSHHSLRSPRRQSAKAVLDPKARVQKPSQKGEVFHNNSRPKAKKLPVKKRESGTKCFPCTFHHYGCGSTFASKNEWKRHVASQHLQLGYYRCDMGSCSPHEARIQHKGYNDFNRKDLFTQHCRRMHAPWVGTKKGEESVSKKERDGFEKQLEGIRARCWIDRRKAPEKSKCGFCGEKFVDGKEAKGWEERMEHVGRHLEKDATKIEDEEVDEGLKAWAINEGVVKPGRKKDEWWLVGFEPVERKNSKGNRRSKRLVVKEEDDVDMKEDIKEEEEVDAESEEDDVEDSIEVKRADIKNEDDSEDDDEDEDEELDADAETDTDVDTDAEAEDDDG